MYTTRPKLPKEIAKKYETILQALNGAMPVTEAAEKLGISAVQCHNLLNRAAAGVLESLLPRKPGRKPSPERERKLAEEMEQLRRENQRLQERTEMIDRLMTAAGGILRGQIRPVRTKKKKSSSSGPNEPEDPDGAARAKVRECETLREAGMNAALAAALVGVSASTMRRWRLLRKRAQPLCQRRGPAQDRETSAEEKKRVGELVRELHGLCGAASLGKATSVSRRTAARIKREVLTEMERERIARCSRLQVSEPGILRSLDQMYIDKKPRQQIALIASDGSVQYRTSARIIPEYTALEVAKSLTEDFSKNGPPLVMRMDRASVHDAPPVLEVLREHEVLLLHGPARYPQYYGQHERQNREHQAWLAGYDVDLEEMLRVLNERWLRRSLGWRPAAAVWNERRPLRVSRRELRQEVRSRAATLHTRLGQTRRAIRLAERLAIEQALEHRGLVRRIPGGW